MTGQEPVQVPSASGTDRLLPAFLLICFFANFNDTEESPMNVIHLQAGAPGSTATADAQAATARRRC